MDLEQPVKFVGVGREERAVLRLPRGPIHPPPFRRGSQKLEKILTFIPLCIFFYEFIMSHRLTVNNGALDESVFN